MDTQINASAMPPRELTIVIWLGWPKVSYVASIKHASSGPGPASDDYGRIKVEVAEMTGSKFDRYRDDIEILPGRRILTRKYTTVNRVIAEKEAPVTDIARQRRCATGAVTPDVVSPGILIQVVAELAGSVQHEAIRRITGVSAVDSHDVAGTLSRQSPTETQHGNRSGRVDRRWRHRGIRSKGRR